MPAVAKLFHATVPVLRQLLPHIPNLTVRAAVASLADGCQQELEKKLSTYDANIASIDEFLKFASHALDSAMNFSLDPELYGWK